MMLEKAVSSTSLRNLLIIPKNPKSEPKTQCANLFPASMGSRKQQWKGCLTLKCSMEQFQEVAYPKPPEIQWKKELCNSVNLIGIVAAPVEIKHFPSGKVVAWTRLAVKKNATQTSWINLTFWDELAHVAFQHLENGHQIYVSGRLVTDTVESDEGKQQTYYKVVVQQLNFIERNFSSLSSHDQESDSMMAGIQWNIVSVVFFFSIKYFSFFFVFSAKKMSYAANNTGSVVELWQAFFSNPQEWWDNRTNKRNPKGPDFKHKDTGEALWVEGRYNPPWVKSQLAILDTRMGSLAGYNARMPVDMVTADEILSF